MWMTISLLIAPAAIIFYLFHKNSLLEAELKTERKEKEDSMLYARELEVMRDRDQELLQEKEQLSKHFKVLSYEALEQTQKSFLEGAKGELHHVFAQHVTPIKETLMRFDQKVGELEKMRLGDYVSLGEQIKSLLHAQGELRKETQNLAGALRTPHVRGQWGEMQLRRVVELAGMLNHCDFIEQENVLTDSGRWRPDLVIKLPGGRNIVVDAKAPLQAYLEAHSAETEEVRKAKIQELAAHMRSHVKMLSEKKYWEQFERAPEFVILFIPGETFFSAALQGDPSLIESGVDKRVLLATPTTLIALLRAVSYGWRQEVISANAEELSKNARELYKRVKDFSQHFGKIGRHLGQAVQVYNDAVGSLESRVLSAARRFTEKEPLLASEIIEPIKLVESQARELKEIG